MRTFETVVEHIGHTTTSTGLRVKAKLDNKRYPKGVVINNAEMNALALLADPFHGEWNYELQPRT